MTQLEITRTFAAPADAVYKAFTDADQIARWFGPVGFSVPRESVSVDAQVGGHQRLTMVSDDDPSFASPIDATFTEVVENELLVGYEDVTGIPGMEGVSRFELRVELHADGDKTDLVIKQGPYSEEMAEMARQGWESSYTKLDALLAA